MDYFSHVNQMKPKFSLVLGSVSSSNLAILAKVQQEKIKSTCLVPLKHPNWKKKKKKKKWAKAKMLMICWGDHTADIFSLVAQN